MTTYGLMPNSDYRTMDLVLDEVCNSFKQGVINVCEIGVHQGNTSRGIRNYLKQKGRELKHTGVDNQRDFKMGAPFPESNLIIGNSYEVYTKLEDNSQHFIFIDGNHSYPITMLDFLVYSDKVKEGGYIAFHDTGAHIQPMVDFQGIGDMDDEDMYIACRKAVKKLGLLDNKYAGWELIFDRWSNELHTGGILLVKKTNNSELYKTYMQIQ